MGWLDPLRQGMENPCPSARTKVASWGDCDRFGGERSDINERRAKYLNV